MKIKAVAALVIASLFVGYSYSPVAMSQQPSGPSANAQRYGIGVVDISYIFENHLRFKAMMEQMKGDVKKTEEALRKERELIGQQDEKLKQFNPGSPDYKALEERSAETKAKFNLKAAKQRKEFLEREAKIYYQTYLEVNDAIKVYAQSKNWASCSGSMATRSIPTSAKTCCGRSTSRSSIRVASTSRPIFWQA